MTSLTTMATMATIQTEIARASGHHLHAPICFPIVADKLARQIEACKLAFRVLGLVFGHNPYI